MADEPTVESAVPAAAHEAHGFNFDSLNASHNQPFPAIEWIHGHGPQLILNLPDYANRHLASLTGEAQATESQLAWAKDFVVERKLSVEPNALAKAMAVAQDEAWATMPRGLSFFDHQTLWSTVALLLATLLLFTVGRRRVEQALPANRFQSIMEALVLFVRDDIVRPNIHHHPDAWTPFFGAIFIALLACNLFGLIPIFGTATSQIAVTVAFAAVIASLMLGHGVAHNGPLRFWFNLIPVKFSWKPMDLFVYVLLAVLEWLSLFIRPAVLAIRLFANMLAGHTVLLAFLSLGFIVHASAPADTAGSFGHLALSGGLGVLGWLLGIAFYALELLVALIQAYIFTLLSAIFIGSCMHPEH